MGKEATRKPVKKKVKKKPRFGKFFRSVVAELKKVTWPTKKELAKYTVIVIVVVVIFAIIIGLMDIIFGELLRLFTQ